MGKAPKAAANGAASGPAPAEAPTPAPAAGGGESPEGHGKRSRERPRAGGGGGAGRIVAVFLAIVVGLVACAVQLLLPGLLLPRSRLCGPGQPAECKLDGVQDRFSKAAQITGDVRALQKATSDRFEKAKLDGRSPTLLYLGPYDAAPELAPGGILDFSAHMAKWSPRLVLVDANPRVIPRLRQRLVGWGAGEDVATVMQAAICASDSQQDFGLPEERFYERNGLNESARRELEGKMSMVHRSAEDAGVPSEYIEKVPVQCYSAASLLERANITGAELDVLLVDIAGDELTVLHRMMMLLDFRPALISFGWTGIYNMVILEQLQWGTDETFNGFMKPTLSQLAGRGYTLYQSGANIWAVLQGS